MRNKIKRLIRESYRLNKEKLKKGNDIVFLFNKRSNVNEVNFYMMNKEITYLLDKADMV